ncbi:uncharacterized protein L203_104455 [Cryptococcus depauperatus CBS 7841]|uniref:Uncharacterized protein n=1 Tax=Cryptococcus depauperatus CBS 7841 TaxID=1295531 RepID=A0A1E3IGS3_9TREE|nr:hypothetical protein L203_03394 [Cryptococcus depauperatus CBS 7841]
MVNSNPSGGSITPISSVSTSCPSSPETVATSIVLDPDMLIEDGFDIDPVEEGEPTQLTEEVSDIQYGVIKNNPLISLAYESNEQGEWLFQAYQPNPEINLHLPFKVEAPDTNVDRNQWVEAVSSSEVFNKENLIEGIKSTFNKESTVLTENELQDMANAIKEALGQCYSVFKERLEGARR